MRSLPKSPDSPTRANRANAVNYDGSVIVGWDDHSTGFRRGAYWLNESVIRVPAPDVNTLAVGEALGVTSDGSTIVGQNWDAAGKKAAWRLDTATGQQTLLSDNTNDRSGAAGFVNDNTDVILGWVNLFPNGRIPTIWTPQLGWTNLNLFMESQGTYAEGPVTIGNATAISSDGRTVAGFMASIFGNTGWILQIENAMVCHRDPADPSQTSTIHVGFPEGLDEHLAHGDTFGICQHGAP
jgi:uncharacterized membrane protein